MTPFHYYLEQFKQGRTDVWTKAVWAQTYCHVLRAFRDFGGSRKSHLRLKCATSPPRSECDNRQSWLEGYLDELRLDSYSHSPNYFWASLGPEFTLRGRRNTASRSFELSLMTRMPLLKVSPTVTDFYTKALACRVVPLSARCVWRLGRSFSA